MKNDEMEREKKTVVIQKAKKKNRMQKCSENERDGNGAKKGRLRKDYVL